MPKREMFFLLMMYQDGAAHKLGIVKAKSAKAAAKKLGKIIEGKMHKWDGKGAYYLKRDLPNEPLYILEHWGIIEKIPKN